MSKELRCALFKLLQRYCCAAPDETIFAGVIDFGGDNKFISPQPAFPVESHSAAAGEEKEFAVIFSCLSGAVGIGEGEDSAAVGRILFNHSDFHQLQQLIAQVANASGSASSGAAGINLFTQVVIIGYTA